jgi:hypothetical protein
VLKRLVVSSTEHPPAVPLGHGIRKALVAGLLWIAADTTFRWVRNPALDGWVDAYNWPQLFLFAPILFFLFAAVAESLLVVIECVRRAVSRQSSRAASAEKSTVMSISWLRDSLRISGIYLLACLIGDIPMAVNYLASHRAWSFHWWWSNAVFACLALALLAYLALSRLFPFHNPSNVLSSDLPATQRL